MTEDKLTNEEIARVFAMYLGQQTHSCGIVDGKYISYIQVGLIEDVSLTRKLLLTDLKDITDEHAIEVAKIHKSYTTDGRKFNILKFINWLTTVAHIRYDMFLYLISKGYAVPLWFGIDRWANGKTAIELGIAIKK